MTFKDSGVGDAAEAVNNYLCENNEAEMFVTAWFGMVDINTGKVMCGSAGHNPPALINDETGEVKYLDYKPQLVLGAMQNIAYKNNIFQMKANEKLMLYTDGIVEAYNEKGEQFGYERFKQALLEHYDPDPEKFYYNLYDKVYKVWSPKPDDDLTIIIVNRKKE